MELLVVVVNYRSAPWTELCLAALVPELRHLGPNARAVVVDNQSADGSPERLAAFVREHGMEQRVEIVEAAANGGFSFGNNIAIEPWLASLDPGADAAVLLLNPDTEPRPGSLKVLVEFLEQHKDVGIVGARLEHPDGELQACNFRFPGFASECVEALQFGPVTRLLSRHGVVAPHTDVPAPTDWVSGACMLVRRAVFDAVGPMDEGYFLYFEELDFTLRARERGFACWHVPGARVVHHVGKTTGVTGADQAKARRPAYWYASRQRYFQRALGPVRSRLLDMAVVVCDLLGGALVPLRGPRDRRPARFLRDFAAHSIVRKEAANAPARRPGPRAKGSSQPLAKGSR
ncbi:MAG: glycosyltransferase [Planctomycetaceae bacterium]|nr:glycosyltransferase [Planctomycetaceae bacterium]